MEKMLSYNSVIVEIVQNDVVGVAVFVDAVSVVAVDKR